jgi:DNA-binding MarR family transcriptional regulator
VVTANPSSGPEPLTVEFSATVTGGSGTYATALWTFGDGGVGSGIPIAYTYQRPGTFRYSVNVTDSGGHWAVASGTETVRAAAASGPNGVLGLSSETALLLVAAAVGAVIAGFALVRLLRRSAADDPDPVFARPALDVVDSSTSAPAAGVTPESSEATVASAPPATGEYAGDTPHPAPGPLGLSSTEPPSRMPSRSRVRLTQRVLLHIGAQGRIGPDEIGTFGLTQAGMADALGVGQNTLTNVLRRLVAAGVLTQDVRHVSGRPRRLRIYSFTARGEALYRDVRRHRPPSEGTRNSE